MNLPSGALLRFDHTGFQFTHSDRVHAHHHTTAKPYFDRTIEVVKQAYATTQTFIKAVKQTSLPNHLQQMCELLHYQLILWTMQVARINMLFQANDTDELEITCFESAYFSAISYIYRLGPDNIIDQLEIVTAQIPDGLVHAFLVSV
tara:strand:- start:34 stop:474 length:441 start_codon:yes stop_codon:yes gene_type:complete